MNSLAEHHLIRGMEYYPGTGLSSPCLTLLPPLHWASGPLVVSRGPSNSVCSQYFCHRLDFFQLTACWSREGRGEGLHHSPSPPHHRRDGPGCPGRTSPPPHARGCRPWKWWSYRRGRLGSYHRIYHFADKE